MALARIVPLDDAHPLDLAAFATGLDGSVVRPEDPDFEVARQVQNAVIDKRPAAIVRAATATDVVRTVNFARASGLELAVRGGSHSLAGHSTSEGGIVLDLSPMQGLHIDPERRVAWAQAGLTAGAYTRAAAEFGLATPFGDTGSVGIAGLTLGAGIGWLARKHALAIDALLSVEIVTADGQLLVASETEHPDLFWAVRGGGGNFGVVTRFQYRLYPVSTVLGGMLLMPPTREVLRSLQPIASNAPEDLTTISFLMAAPPAPFVPEALHGQLVLALMFVYDGDEASGQAAIQPFRDLAAPLAEVVAPMPYPGIYEFLKDAEQRVPGSHRSVFLESIDDRTIDTILERMAEPPSPMTMVQLRVLGGAMARVPVEATAFAHRTAPAMVVILNLFPDPADAPRQQAWTQSFYEELAPRSTGVYVNFLEDEGDERIREAYPVATYRRLAEIKRRYDPDNLFRLNQNIPPADEG